MSLIKHFIPLCGALTVALLPRLAAAQECGADNPCPEGFTCETGMTDVACPAIACAEGTDCMQPDCGPSEPYSYCTPKTCDPDGAADQCGANMVCFSYESGMCSGSAGAAPACPDGADCPMTDPAVEPMPAECTTTVESYCTYKYQLPCAEAVDCGEGFDCVAYEITTCSGGTAMGGGTEPSSGDAAPAPAPAEQMPTEPVVEECTTELSTEKYCQVIDVTCETDAECAEGWTCMDQGTAVSGCATTEPAPDAPAPTDPPAEGGSGSADPIAPTCEMPEPMPVEKKCAPPGYYYGFAADGVATSAEAGGVLGDGTMASGTPSDPSAPQEAPTVGAPGSNTNTDDVAANASNGGGETDTAAGCSVGSAPATGNTGFAGLLLGLAALAMRRRR